jgi:hypothetical protein
MVYRHPFPGPGLGVRILGEVKPEFADLLRRADAIFIDELRAAGWYEKTSQAFAVFLPVKSVGVMGDGRTYEYVVALRAVETQDFMTAHWAELPHSLLGKVSNRIINEVRGINRVVYDISGKPPATIEWEDAVDRDAGAGERFGEAARNRQLSRLGDPVVDHLGGNLNAAFARNEDDPAPVGAPHRRQAETGEADTAQHVGGKEPHPVDVGDLGKWRGLEDAEIVDQDFDVGILPHQRLGGIGSGEIAGEPQHVAAGGRADGRHGSVHGGLGAAIDDHPGAFGGEPDGDGVTDSRRAAGDQRQPVLEFHVHQKILSVKTSSA